MYGLNGAIALCLLSLSAAGKIDVKSAYNEYCDICADHTLCKFQGLGEACDGSQDGGVTEEEKRYIVNGHNWYRKILARGLVTRGANGTSQPKASNMMKMVWDEELQKIAQHWADQCLFEHDTCRHDRRWKVGQNIYWHWRLPIVRSTNWTAVMESWFDEVELFHPDSVPFYEFSPETGHYTQLAWHDSVYIGCGRRSYGPNKIYVCNYGPTGNWLSEPLYQIGEPCSQCPAGTFCDDGLCANPTEPTTDSTTALTSDESEEKSTGSEMLQPPAPDAVSIYSVTESEQYDITTDPPIHHNLIFNEDEFDIPDDEGIRKDIEDIKQRIKLLVDRIALKKLSLLKESNEP